MRARGRLVTSFVTSLVAVGSLRCFGTEGLQSGRVVDAAPDAPDAAVPDGASDAAADADGACTDDAPFSRVARLDALAGPTREGHPRLLPDERTIYFQRAKTNDPAALDFDLWVATRGSRQDPFGAPLLVTELETARDEAAPATTADGLTLYFASNRDGDGGLMHLFRTGRPATTDPFGLVQLVPATTGDGLANETNPAVDPLGRELFYASDRGSDAGLALWSARVAGGVVQVPSPVGLPSPAASPALSADGLSLYFTFATQIYYARRDADGGFGAPVPAPGLASSASDRPGWISPDRCRLYFARNADAQNSDIFVAERDP